MQTKDITRTALLAAAALGIFMLESQLPPIVPIPGVKLGLANMITLTAMTLFGRKTAGLVLTIRIILGSIFAGNTSAFLYAASGGACAYLVMCLAIGSFDKSRQLWIVSILGALAHNAGQLFVARIITGTPGILYYGFALAAAAILTGLFTGLCAQYLCRALRGHL